MIVGSMRHGSGRLLLVSLVVAVLVGNVGVKTGRAAAVPQSVGVGSNCTWKKVWEDDVTIMQDRKSPKTDVVMAEWMEPCKVTFKASKNSSERTAVLQLQVGKKWTDFWDGAVEPSGRGSFTLNDDLGYWDGRCDYRKFPYRIVVRGGKKPEILNNKGLLFLFSETYYDCNPMDTDEDREYYNLGADPDKNACWNVLCKSKGTPVFSHESRYSTGVQNAAGEWKCYWYKFYVYKDGTQAPSKKMSEWWGASRKCN